MKQKQRILHVNKAPKTLGEDRSIFKMNCDGTKNIFLLFRYSILILLWNLPLNAVFEIPWLLNLLKAEALTLDLETLIITEAETETL